MTDIAIDQSPWRFLISRNDPTKTKITSDKPIEREDLNVGQSLISIERFSFTANNILYVSMGNQNRYWDLFPAEGEWGNSPAWGVGRVLESKSDILKKGSLIFGFFPLASQCIIQPGELGPRHIVDNAQHRILIPTNDICIHLGSSFQNRRNQFVSRQVRGGNLWFFPSIHKPVCHS